MGTKTIVLSGFGKYETEIRIWVPDGDRRAIEYLNQKYPNQWREPERTISSLTTQRSLTFAATDESGLKEKLRWLQKRAIRSLNPTDKPKKNKRK